MNDKVAVVVGGGSGMGAATARRLARDGFQVAVLNLRMNNVLPGWIDSLPATDERRQRVPMQRYGTSDEIAATIAFSRQTARPTAPARAFGSMAA